MGNSAKLLFLLSFTAFISYAQNSEEVLHVPLKVLGSDKRESIDTGESPKESISTLSTSGKISQRYQFRKSGGTIDQDLYGYFSFEGTSQTQTLSQTWRESPSFRFSIDGSYQLDIDSYQKNEGTTRTAYPQFFGVSNTFGDRFHGFLHSAYVESSKLLPFENIRLGRQMIYRDEGILFDGGYLRSRSLHGLSFDVYGGVPTHFYESSPSGDVIAGSGVTIEPIENLKIGTDYLFIRDNRKEFSDAEDRISRIHAQYRFLRNWDLKFSASWNDTKERRQHLDLRYYSEEFGFMLNVRAIHQEDIVGFRTNEFSPFLFVTGDYSPYYLYQVDVFKSFSETIGVGGGFTSRQLEKESSSRIYNRSFRNSYVSLDLQEIWPGMNASIRGDLWDADNNTIASAGFEIEQKIMKKMRLRLGTNYSLYHIDSVTGEERIRDRNYYIKILFRMKKQFDLEMQYQYEKESYTEYHKLVGGITLCF